MTVSERQRLGDQMIARWRQLKDDLNQQKHLIDYANATRKPGDPLFNDPMTYDLDETLAAIDRQIGVVEVAMIDGGEIALDPVLAEWCDLHMSEA